MNVLRLAFATLGGFVTYFVFGGLAFAALPSLRAEMMKYPAVYRPQEGQMKAMPYGMAAMLVSILVMAVLYAMIYKGGSGLVEGARLGALIGVFAVGAFVVHNYVNLNVGPKLMLQQAVAYFVEWVVTGIVIGLIYRPVLAR
jgi:hypothetical protein